MVRLGNLAKSSIAVMCWQSARLGLQFVWLVLLARLLGVEGYGSFAGLAGLAMALSGIVGFGLGLRMYQDVARDPSLYSVRWQQTRLGLWWSGAATIALFVALAHWQFGGFGWWLLVAIAVSELALSPIATQIAFAYAAHGRMSRSAAVPVVLAAGRVGAVVAFGLTGGVGIEAYAPWHAAATAAATIVLLAMQRRELRHTAVAARLSWPDLRNGLGFSAVWASSVALTSADKALALRVGGTEIAGQYSAAYRFVTVVAVPVDALVMAVTPRLFRASRGDPQSPRMLAALSSVTAAYGALAGVLVWLGADALPWLLGAGFAATPATALMLAFYVPVYCLRMLAGGLLIGGGRKAWRCGVELTALGVMLGVGLVRIPAAGLDGAVEALLVGETLLLGLAWWGVLARPRMLAEARA
jgi:O-antigen/teichoic acid export membrane protein